MTPYFSVVIPAYNRAHVLADALNSVLCQTDQDFEILVIDDGSRDNPKAVVDSFGDARIRLFRQDNRGGGAARNVGIDNARGKFVALLDSDDEFMPHHLERMRHLLSDTVDTAGYARILVNRGGGRAFLKPPRALAPGEHMATYLLCDRGFTPTSSTVVPADMARRIRFDENLREAEDTDFGIRLFLSGCQFVMAEAAGAIWRDRYDPGRVSSRRSSPRLAQWLETMKPKIPRKAYLGARGWAVAKGDAASNRWLALRHYLTAVMHGCYRPGLAGVIFLQIFLPDRFYRVVADGAIGWLGAGYRAANPSTAQAPNEIPSSSSWFPLG